MGEGCSHNCSSCGSNCSGAANHSAQTQIPKEKQNKLSSVKKVIAVVSGKGGVGKSMVTSLMAVSMQRKGYHSAILDADITGPSIPRSFNLKERAMGDESGIYPVKTKTGIDVMSINLMLNKETDPVIWRGPVIAGTVKQFWTDVIWKDVDFMFIDMPPGTGDVPLTVYQSFPVDGIVVVTSPQELVSMIVAKAVNMAKIMHVPVLGIVENMSYFECPSCGGRHNIFGESHVEEIARNNNIENVARLPINANLAAECDKGSIEQFEGNWLDGLANSLEDLLKSDNSKVNQ